jgi:hypothetical protein
VQWVGAVVEGLFELAVDAEPFKRGNEVVGGRADPLPRHHLLTY